MIFKPLLKQLCVNEIEKILIPISYQHHPSIVKDIANSFACKHQHILHPKGKSPNQSLTDLLNDIHYAPNGYFI